MLFTPSGRAIVRSGQSPSGASFSKSQGAPEKQGMVTMVGLVPVVPVAAEAVKVVVTAVAPRVRCRLGGGRSLHTGTAGRMAP